MLKVVKQITIKIMYSFHRGGTLAVVGRYSNHNVFYDQSSTVAAPVVPVNESAELF